MAMVTISGYIGSRELELKDSKNGKRLNFRLGSQNGSRDEDRDSTWFNVTCFDGRDDTFAQNVAASFKKGDYVHVIGNFENYDKEITNADGEEATIQMLSFRAFDVLAGTRYGAIQVTRKRRSRDEDEDDEPAPRKTTSRARKAADEDEDDEPAPRKTTSRSRKPAADDDDF